MIQYVSCEEGTAKLNMKWVITSSLSYTSHIAAQDTIIMNAHSHLVIK